VEVPGPVNARDAATIMLVRDTHVDGDDSLEVCMLRRHLDSDFVGGAYVFPGGKVEDSDRDGSTREVCRGRSDAEASALLEIPTGGLAFWVAALRECFEEAGVVLAYRAESDPQSLVDATSLEVRARLRSLRQSVNAGELEFFDACRQEGICLAVDRVHYFSHWVTPEMAPKRYDTRFFVAALPPGQVPVHDDLEMVDTVWVQPAEALRRAREGQFDVIFPTMKNLQAISRFKTSSELLEAAAAVERVPTILPRVVADGGGVRIVLPGDPDYELAQSSGDEAKGSPGSGAGKGARSAPVTVSDMSAMVRRIDIDGVSRPRDPD
jgi:8-oxo-dGTP pyrophosphatase MutT (NUDIX family)